MLGTCDRIGGEFVEAAVMQSEPDCREVARIRDYTDKITTRARRKPRTPPILAFKTWKEEKASAAPGDDEAVGAKVGSATSATPPEER